MVKFPVNNSISAQLPTVPTYLSTATYVYLRACLLVKVLGFNSMRLQGTVNYYALLLFASYDLIVFDS